LNGRETITGGTIIMPIDMSTAATTRSMNQKSSVVQTPKSVRWALTSDKQRLHIAET